MRPDVVVWSQGPWKAAGVRLSLQTCLSVKIMPAESVILCSAYVIKITKMIVAPGSEKDLNRPS